KPRLLRPLGLASLATLLATTPAKAQSPLSFMGGVGIVGNFDDPDNGFANLAWHIRGALGANRHVTLAVDVGQFHLGRTITQFSACGSNVCGSGYTTLATAVYGLLQVNGKEGARSAYFLIGVGARNVQETYDLDGQTFSRRSAGFTVGGGAPIVQLRRAVFGIEGRVHHSPDAGVDAASVTFYSLTAFIRFWQ
ncbi:MAG TPA: hypothetical protein VGI83_02810, partial [Gemmatimonadales bacterium]